MCPYMVIIEESYEGLAYLFELFVVVALLAVSVRECGAELALLDPSLFDLGLGVESRVMCPYMVIRPCSTSD
jgi:hypothetical protein